MPATTNKDGTPSKRGQHLNGRPKGVKNKATLFKEIMRQGFENKLQKDFKRVLNVVVEKACEGDMVAAKMLMDRVIPTSRAIDLDDLEKSKGLQISINVGSLEQALEVSTSESHVIDGEVVYGEVEEQ